MYNVHKYIICLLCQYHLKHNVVITCTYDTTGIPISYNRQCIHTYTILLLHQFHIKHNVLRTYNV